MAGWLTGESVMPCDAADPRQRIVQVTGLLQTLDSPAARQVAQAFADHLATGRSLDELLGVRLKRGGAFDQYHRREPLQRRNAAQLATILRSEGR